MKVNNCCYYQFALYTFYSFMFKYNYGDCGDVSITKDFIPQVPDTKPGSDAPLVSMMTQMLD